MLRSVLECLALRSYEPDGDVTADLGMKTVS